MNRKPVYVVDLFERVVQKMNDNLDFTVYYQYGRAPEVINSLTIMEKNPESSVTKYPLVYLVMPFTEDNDTMEQEATVDLHVILIAKTRQEWRAAKRYAEVFKPTLYPMYDELIRQIALSSYFQEHSEYSIKHSKTDWPHFGEKGNFCNDFTDAIDITNLRLRLNFANCQTI